MGVSIALLGKVGGIVGVTGCLCVCVVIHPFVWSARHPSIPLSVRPSLCLSSH